MLPADPDAAAPALEALGVTDRSLLGALAVNTGGLAVDHGWLRVLGGPACWSGATASTAASSSGTTSSPASTRSTSRRARSRYLAPETLEWAGIEMGHSEWVHWTLAGDVAAFYEHLRWPGWQEETATLEADQGFEVDPPPFTREGRIVADAGAQAREDDRALEAPAGLHREFGAVVRRRLPGRAVLPRRGRPALRQARRLRADGARRAARATARSSTCQASRSSRAGSRCCASARHAGRAGG